MRFYTICPGYKNTNFDHFFFRFTGSMQVPVLTFMICLGLLQVTIAIPTKDTIILKQNYGIIFTRTSTIDMGHSVWWQIFAFDFFNITDFNTYIQPPDCRLKGFIILDHCNKAQHLVDMLNQQRRHLIDKLTQDIQQMTDIIPESQSDIEHHRNKRAIFGFIGSWLADSFGLLGPDAAKELDDHMNKLKKVEKQTAKQINKLSGNFVSYVRTANNRFLQVANAFNNITKRMAQDEFYFNLQAMNITKLHESIDLIFDLLQNVQSTNAGLSELYSMSTEWLLGVKSLSRGFLPEQFVTRAQLLDAISEINIKLDAMGRGFNIAQSNPAYYYHLRNIGFKRDNTRLLISVPIPIKNVDTYFFLYKIYATPVLVNSSMPNATYIHGLPDYLAVNSETTYFIELSKEFIDGCKGDLTLSCPTVPAAKSKSYPTCAFAIFMDDKENVHKLCDFRYQQDYQEQSAIDLGSGKFFMTGRHTAWTMVCADHHPIPKPSCSPCIIHLGCSCSLQSKDFFITARLTECHPTKQLLVHHGINLGYLGIFRSDVDLSKYNGDTTFENKPEYNTPTITIHNDTVIGLAASTENFHLDLKKIARNVATDNDNYQSTAGYILSQNLGLSKKFLGYTATDIIQFTLIAYSIFTLLVLGFIFIKLRQLQTAIIILSRAPLASTFTFSPITFSSFDIDMTNDETTTDTTPPFYKQATTWESLTAVICLGLLIYGLCKLGKCLWNRFMTCCCNHCNRTNNQSTRTGGDHDTNLPRVNMNFYIPTVLARPGQTRRTTDNTTLDITSPNSSYEIPISAINPTTHSAITSPAAEDNRTIALPTRQMSMTTETEDPPTEHIPDDRNIMLV